MKYLKIFMVVTVVALGLHLVSSQHVNALADVFPDSAITYRTSGGGVTPEVTATVSYAGLNTLQNPPSGFQQQLNAQVSVIKLYYTQPDNNSVTIQWMCHTGSDPPGTRANFDIYNSNSDETIGAGHYFSEDSDSGGCDANGHRTITGINGLTQSTVLGREAYYVAILKVEIDQTAQPGTKSFRAVAGGAGSVATFAELSATSRVTDQNPLSEGYAYNASAMLDMWGNQGSKSQFGLDFAPDCAINGEYEDMYLKWFDADYDSVNRPANNNTKFEVYDETNGHQLVASATGTSHWSINGLPGTNLGNNNEFGYLGLTTTKNHRYSWRWSEVDRNNGIQLWMPYSEINTAITCKPPNPPPEGSFDQVNCQRAVGWAFDKDDTNAKVQIHMYIDGDWAGSHSADKPRAGSFQGVALDGHGFEIDIGDYATANVRKVHLYAIDPADNTINRDLGEKDVGPCLVWAVDQAQCDLAVNKQTISGWVLNKGHPDRTLDVHVYVDKPAVPPNPVPSFTVTANGVRGDVNGPGKPHEPDPVPATLALPGFVIQGSTIDDYSDAFQRKYHLYMIGGNGTNPYMGEFTIPRCRPPVCTAPTTSTGKPAELGTEFGIRAGFNYTNAAHVRAFKFTVTITVSASNVPGPQTTPIDWSSVGSDPARPPGLPGSSEGEVNPPYIVSAEGVYSIGYVLTYYNAAGTEIYTDGSCGLGGSGENVLKISRVPYFKIYGNDAQAGGVFEDKGTKSCPGVLPTSTATFRGYNKAGSRPHVGSDPTYNYYRGSGAQFALFALGAIEEVPSLGMADSSVRQVDHPIYQTFANWQPSSTVTDYGGNSGLARTCIPDYFAAGKGFVAPPAAGVTPVGTPTGNTLYYNGPVIINGTNNFTGSQAIYVNGDVRIANGANIQYGSFANKDDAPNFTLIAKGNIYIDNETSQLDGWYIAQPTTPTTKGQIITCYLSEGGTPVEPANMSLAGSTGCGNKLTVNGAFIARQVKLLRTEGSLSKGVDTVPAPPDFEWFHMDIAADLTRQCITIRESGLPGPHTYGPTHDGAWYDNWLCARKGLDIEWVNNGAYGLGGNSTPEQAGYIPSLPQGPARNKEATSTQNGQLKLKECVQFYEPAMLNTLTSWNDNWFCMNKSDEYDLRFYHGGDDNRPANPGTCVPIYEPSDTLSPSHVNPKDLSVVNPSPTPQFNSTWHDNWLCVVQIIYPLNSTEPSDSPNIAEVFNFSPELYLNPTKFEPPRPGVHYDSVRTAPPIF